MRGEMVVTDLVFFFIPSQAGGADAHCDVRCEAGGIEECGSIAY